MTSIQSVTAQHPPGAPPPRWPWWAFRICITVTAVLVFDQAVFAGQFLAGSYASLLTHRNNATAASVAMLLSVVAAVLVRRPGRGPLWPLAGSAGLFLLIGIQFFLGVGRVLTLHVPVGVTIIGLTAALAWRAWRVEPARTPASQPVPAQLPRQDAVISEADDEDRVRP